MNESTRLSSTICLGFIALKGSFEAEDSYLSSDLGKTRVVGSRERCPVGSGIGYVCIKL